MNDSVSASLARVPRRASMLAALFLMALALSAHAAAAQLANTAPSPIPSALRAAIDRTLGAGQWTEQQEVTETDPGFTPQFGIAVALHGTTAMVGAQQAKIGDNEDQGAVYVFEESGGTWTRTQKLVADDGQAYDTFGHSIVFEGTTALIGAYGATVGGNASQGAVYVFTQSGGSWSQTQKLTADDGQMFENFGYSLGLSGSTAMIGADAATVGENGFQGAVYVFDESGGTWTQGQKLVASDGGIGDIFGYSIAFDGTTAMVGAYANNQYQGAVYVFGNAGGSWTESQKLVADDGASNTYFGYATALSGSTLLVGAWGSNPGGNDTQGAAYVFTESNGNWSQTQELVSDDGQPFDNFGHAVALDGTRALIGADGVDSAQGAVYAFDEADGSWSQTQKFYASDGAPSFAFGLAVALDGSTALVGSWAWMSPDMNLQGSAYFFASGPGDAIFADGFDGVAP